MENNLQQGYFVLADISGYTSYLADVELEHAQGLLADLLELIVERFKSVLTLSRLEGDAVFAYTSATTPVPGEALLALIEATYTDFRDRQEAFRRNKCECSACQSLPTLDLKFIIHYGEFHLQRVSGFQELVGTDVNLAHRLMKNHVSEATHWRAYVLLTESALTQMGLTPAGLHEQTEMYSHLRPVKTFSLNLQAHYQAQLNKRQVFLKSDEADMVIQHDLALPPHEVWSWLNDPQRRLQWEGFSTIRADDRLGGRRGMGGGSECSQGKTASTEKILDWRPFDYYTVQFKFNLGRLKIAPVGTLITFQLETTPMGGTQLHVLIKAQLPLPAWLARRLAKPFLQAINLRQKYRRLADLAGQGPMCVLPGLQAASQQV